MSMSKWNLKTFSRKNKHENQDCRREHYHEIFHLISVKFFMKPYPNFREKFYDNLSYAEICHYRGQEKNKYCFVTDKIN